MRTIETMYVENLNNSNLFVQKTLLKGIINDDFQYVTLFKKESITVTFNHYWFLLQENNVTIAEFELDENFSTLEKNYANEDYYEYLKRVPKQEGCLEDSFLYSKDNLTMIVDFMDNDIIIDGKTTVQFRLTIVEWDCKGAVEISRRRN